MKYSIDRQEKFTVMSLEEDNLNSLLAPDLKSQFVILHNEGVPNVILDLGKVKYVDSSGLSAILTGNRLWKNNGVFVVTGVDHPAVKKLVEISRLSSILHVLPTVDESVDFIFMDELERDLRREEEE